MNGKEENAGFYIQDIVHSAVHGSANLMAEIQQEISNIRNVQVSWKNAFFLRKELDKHQKHYNDLFSKFSKTYILDPNEKDAFNSGIIFDSQKGTFSYAFASLPSAMRNNLKNDTKIVNEGIVLIGLAAQSASYLNMVSTVRDSLAELNREITNKYQELNTQQMFILNSIMLGLTTIAVILTLIQILPKASYGQHGVKKLININHK